MSYGLTFTNNSDVVTLDSEFSRLVIVEQGSWSGSGNGVFVPFKQAVMTAEPPLVFCRPDTSNGSMYFCLIIGSAGAWTGFRFQAGRDATTTGKWFAASFSSQPTATYGLRIWDGTSKLLFDSDTPCAQFTRTITAWTYLGAVQSPPGSGQYFYSWTAVSPLDTGDYMLLNNIAMDVAGVVSRQGNLYASWQYSNNRLVMQAIGVDLPGALYLPVVFAKPVS
ncbi:hypothetical protein P3S72_12660 [Pseudomonas sp. D3]|uniref:hypothetical protein n=1 Tax=Pseudomonas sp. D3 TaxID=517398 RepID=UPI0023E3A12F|nr:hypothetical protein [Pseudomonas sp. D3]WET12940.1 hypothetical protein P3S72_12660 [Pseudomonas sp. D3]